MINNLVNSKKNKYGNSKTNGRPKKKSAISQAERRINNIVSDKVIFWMVHRIVFFGSH